jgi:hypothetical protein
VTFAEPGETLVKVTEQLPLADKMQLAPTVPTAILDEVKVTVPVGVFAAFVVSVTVAVQEEVAGGRIRLGLQETAVDVLSLPVAVIAMVPEVPELEL